MKKVGLLALALVIAVGGLGIGYAAWIDTLYIDGTVNTGSVDVEVVELSGTWLYKLYPDGDEMLHGWGTASNPIPPTAGGIEGEDYDLIAFAEADFDLATESDGDAVDVEFKNIMPGLFMVDFLVHYVGTVPARLCVDLSGIPTELQALIGAAAPGPYAGYEAYEWTGFTALNVPNLDGGMYYDDTAPLSLCGIQLHECDWIIIKLWIDLPQTGDDVNFPDSLTQGQDYDVNITVKAIQWNEYETECPDDS